MPEKHRSYIHLLPPVGEAGWRQYAWCLDCDWQGPIRDTDAQADRDRGEHERHRAQLPLLEAT